MGSGPGCTLDINAVRSSGYIWVWQCARVPIAPSGTVELQFNALHACTAYCEHISVAHHCLQFATNHADQERIYSFVPPGPCNGCNQALHALVPVWSAPSVDAALRMAQRFQAYASYDRHWCLRPQVSMVPNAHTVSCNVDCITLFVCTGQTRLKKPQCDRNLFW